MTQELLNRLHLLYKISNSGESIVPIATKSC